MTTTQNTDSPKDSNTPTAAALSAAVQASNDYLAARLDQATGKK